MAYTLVLNIPHSSSFIPQNDRLSAFSHSSEAELNQELLAMTDWFTDELFDHGLGTAVVAQVSRLVCDTERFSHDENEPMAARGMGYCYTNGSCNQRIKEFPSSYKDEVMWRYYAPHHVALTDAVAKALEKGKDVLVLDCHSFSATPLAYEPEQNPKRPDICIGTDSFHTPSNLADLARGFFVAHGLSVEFNTPYAGTIVPLRYYGNEKRVQSIMIETNRGLYLKDGTNEKKWCFPAIQGIIKEFELLLTKCL